MRTVRDGRVFPLVLSRRRPTASSRIAVYSAYLTRATLVSPHNGYAADAVAENDDDDDDNEAYSGR